MKDLEKYLLFAALGYGVYLIYKQTAGGGSVPAERAALVSLVNSENADPAWITAFNSMSDTEIVAMYNWLIVKQPPTAQTSAIQAKYNLYGS